MSKKTTQLLSPKATHKKTKKLLKEKNQQVFNILSLLPFKFYRKESSYGTGYFECDDGKIIDIIQIRGKDLSGATLDEIDRQVRRHSRFYRAYEADFAIISMNFPTETKPQQESLLKHKSKLIERQENRLSKMDVEGLVSERENIISELENIEYLLDVSEDLEETYTLNNDIQSLNKQLKILNLKLTTPETYETLFDLKSNILVNLEEESTVREAFFFLFAKNLDHYNSLLNVISLNSFGMDFISQEKKEHVLWKMNNMAIPYQGQKSIVSSHEGTRAFDQFLNKNNHDPILISRIQPIGNIKLSHERYIKTGTGYTTCLQIYDIPDIVNDFWLSDVMNIDGTCTVMSVGTENRDDVIDKISTSINELNTRMKANSSGKEIAYTERELSILDTLLKELTQHDRSEVIKLINLRIYVAAETIAKLEKRIADVIGKLRHNSYISSVFLNETDLQYKAMWATYSEQEKFRNKRAGFPVPTVSLAGGYPFNNQHLLDPHGIYLGKTFTGGNVLLNMFHKTKKRLSYDFMTAGKKGAGKSTLLKIIETNTAITDNYVRVIDPVGEYQILAHALGATIISVDGTNTTINLLEVFKVSDNDETNFTFHLSKLNSIFQLLRPESDSDIKNLFENCVRQLYEDKNLWSNTINSKITGLSPEKYPLMEELLALVRSNLYENYHSRNDNEQLKVNPHLSPQRTQQYEAIEVTIANIVENYPTIFNRHTSLRDLSDEHIVIFDFSKLTNYKEEIFNTILFNVLTMLFDTMIKLGIPNMQAVSAGVDPSNISKLLILIDEAHRFINSNNLMVVDYILSVVREARKYLASLGISSQSVRDYFPKTSGEAFEKINKLFELMQYKFIFEQDDNAKSVIRESFGNALTDSQIEDIPELSQGDCYLITGEETLKIHVDLSDFEGSLFDGGL